MKHFIAAIAIALCASLASGQEAKKDAAPAPPKETPKDNIVTTQQS